MSLLLHLFLFVAVSSLKEPDEYILSFPKTDNPKNIKIINPVNKNYFLVIGDWAAGLLYLYILHMSIIYTINRYYRSRFT